MQVALEQSKLLLNSPDHFLLQWHVAALEDPVGLEVCRIDHLELTFHVILGAEDGAADGRADRLGQVLQFLAGDDLDEVPRLFAGWMTIETRWR